MDTDCAGSCSEGRAGEGVSSSHGAHVPQKTADFGDKESAPRGRFWLGRQRQSSRSVVSSFILITTVRRAWDAEQTWTACHRKQADFGPLWHGREISVEVWVHSMRAHLAIVVELQAAAADRVHDRRVVHHAHRNVCREIAHSSGCDIPSVCTEPPQVRLAWPAGARAAMKTKSGASTRRVRLAGVVARHL